MKTSKPSNRLLLTKVGVCCVIGLVFVLVLAGYYGGLRAGSKNTVTKTLSAETSISTVITTRTFTSLTTTFLTSTSLAVQPLPPMVRVMGDVATSSPGTSPAKVTFIDTQDSTKTATVDVTNNKYSITITNSRNYVMQIGYSALIAGGSCVAGILVISTTSDQLIANLKC